VNTIVKGVSEMIEVIGFCLRNMYVAVLSDSIIGFGQCNKSLQKRLVRSYLSKREGGYRIRGDIVQCKQFVIGTYSGQFFHCNSVIIQVNLHFVVVHK
jgi:hypothetical protein